MHLLGRIFLDTDEGVLLAAQRVRLLEAIERLGSIQGAAKELGLSYKSAWDAVNAMNKLCDRPLVLREVGGRRGRGSCIPTPTSRSPRATSGGTPCTTSPWARSMPRSPWRCPAARRSWR